MARSGSVRLRIDGDWTLFDLSRLGRTYTQLYSLLFVVGAASEGPSTDGDAGVRAFRSYPWRGGYSAVNFYEGLRRSVPAESRPVLKALRYESPGWIDLTLAVPAAIALKHIVQAFADAGVSISTAYNTIYRQLQERRLMRLDLKRQKLEITRQQERFARSAGDELAGLLEFPDVETLRHLAPNELAALKILMSLFRRAKILAEYEADGRLQL